MTMPSCKGIWEMKVRIVIIDSLCSFMGPECSAAADQTALLGLRNGREGDGLRGSRVPSAQESFTDKVR